MLLAGLSLPAWCEPTLGEALERAWERAAAVQLAQSRRAEADAGRALAAGWWAQPPSITLAQTRDRFARAQGEREREVELALPLWLPGQRAAQQAFVDADLADSQAALAAARLQVAGELRAALWGLAAARAERESAARRLAAAEQLEADVARREQAGELARSDLLLASEDRLAAHGALVEARQRERQASAQASLLTGLESLPVDIAEAVRPAGQEAETHPRLRLAEASLEQARAALRQVEGDRRDPPELAFGLQRVRSDAASPERSALRIGLRIPFSTPARNAPRLAGARAALILAEVAQRQVLDTIEAEQREALAALEDAQALQQHAQARSTLAGQRLALQGKAFRLGELALAEFIRARSAADEAQLILARAAQALGAARAQVNQSRGLLP